MATILGVSAFYHDAAAALVRDGEILAAAQEERFSRKKHDPRFPRHAINYCLEEGFLDARDLDAVVFYENPVLTFDRIVKCLLATIPEGREQWSKAAPVQLGVKLRFAEMVRRELGDEVRVLYSAHHLSHAASAFYPCPFERAAVLVMDGVGEWATTSLGVGDGAKLELLREIRYPHSLGLLYSAFTYYCGFKVNSGEYKLMGLAPYGEPRYADLIRRELIDLRPDGSYRLNLEYFDYVAGLSTTSERFHALFGEPPRAPESRITRRDVDLAASIQLVLEEAVLGLARQATELAGSRQLALAGGVALNCVANGRLLRSGVVDDLWVQPAAGDAGGALGAALATSHLYFGVERRPRGDGSDRMHGGYLGPRFSGDEVRAFLDRKGIPYKVEPDLDRRVERVAAALDAGKVVGWLSGRMEFGPRALGARSILGNPMDPDAQSRINLKIKFRESFRPFAPSVLAEDAADYFELDCQSPYMLLVAPVRHERRRPMDWGRFRNGDDDLLVLVNQARSDLPAITHVDYSARVQTVHPDDHPSYHRLLEAFRRLSGHGVVVNTSFNVRGEPIVCTPEDAYRCFMRTEMDLLVLEDCVLEKHQQPSFEDSEDWRREYGLD
jgi:carbamoyltransferase